MTRRALRGRRKVKFGDLVGEAIASARGNGRSYLFAMFGTVVGSGLFVLISGISSTLETQVTEEFDETLATQITIQPNKEIGDGWRHERALDRLRSIDGVEAVGLFYGSNNSEITHPVTGRKSLVAVRPVSGDAIEVVQPSIRAGTSFSAFHQEQTVPVILLSVSAARNLEIGSGSSATVRLADRDFTVVGVFDQVEREPAVLTQAVVPASSLPRVLLGEPKIVASIDPKKGDSVARLAALAVAPDDMNSLTVTKPLDPREFRRRVEGPVKDLTGVASLVALLAGSVSIANSATAAVFARQAEIGLRAVLGAQPLHIFTQITLETAAVGTVGGVVGSLLGSGIVVGVAAWNGWPLLLEPQAMALAILATSAAGVAAGIPAARRALRIQPVDALRS